MMAINGPLSEAIGLAVLHLLWQGALIAGVLAIALRLLANSTANVRYAVSCAALAALVMFGVATGWSSYEPTPAFLATEALPVTAGASETTFVEPGTLDVLAMTVRMYSSTIAVVWLIGVVLLAARLALSWSRTRQIARVGTSVAPEEWQQVVATLSRALGVPRVVRLVQSAAVDVPSVIGFLKPVVLVPATSLSGLSARQLEMILAHELAHIRRHDYLVNMMQSVAETLLFYHPAAWWISRQIRIERENCCDDLAIATCGNPIEYARALTMLEELRGAPLLAVAASGGSLMTRVRRLVGLHDRQLANGWTAVAAAVSFAVVMMVTSLPVRADRDEVEAPPSASEIDVVSSATVPAPPPAPEPQDPETPPNPPDPPDEERPTPALAPMAVPAFPELADVDFDVDYGALAVLAPPAPAPAPAPPAPAAIAMAAANLAAFDDDDADEPASRSGRLSVDELIALRIHNVTPAYINEMRALFPEATLGQLRSLKTMGVSSKYVADMRAAGVNITTTREAVALRTHNVKPEFVRSLAAAGYPKLSVRDLTRLAVAGVNADFVREMSKYRTDPKKK